jgi:Holliday junction resolvasome RuvABC endonuclease subunit
MQFMVARLLGVGSALAEDEADALGAAICHVYVRQFNALVASASTAWGGGGSGRRSWRR